MTWTTSKRALPVLRLMLLAALAGCSQTLNDRLTLGGAQLPPTFDGPVPGARTGPAVLFGADPRPRSAWTPTTYIAAFDGVVHGHTFVLRAPLEKVSTPREYGRFPTRRDALALQSSGWFEDLMMTIDELGRSFIGTPYAIGYWVWVGEIDEPTLSPSPYKRTAGVGWASGYPAPPADEHKPRGDLPPSREEPAS